LTIISIFELGSNSENIFVPALFCVYVQKQMDEIRFDGSDGARLDPLLTLRRWLSLITCEAEHEKIVANRAQDSRAVSLLYIDHISVVTRG